MLTREEIEERLNKLTALGAMSTEAHALETAQQLAEWLDIVMSEVYGPPYIDGYNAFIDREWWGEEAKPIFHAGAWLEGTPPADT